MGVQVEIRNFKCFNQLRNGDGFAANTSEFTPNLVGNVGEKVRVSYEVFLGWDSYTGPGQTWTIQPDRLIRTEGSFIDDGFTVGDVFEFYNDWANRSFVPVVGTLFTAEVDQISTDGKILEFTVLAGVNSLTGAVDNVGIWSKSGNTPNVHRSVLFKYGLIGNDEDFNFLSKVTNSEQVFYCPDATITPNADFISLGKNKDWVTESDTGVTVVFDQFPSEVKNSIKYTISHDLVITPWFVVGQLANLQNLTIPALLAGDNSLKYAFEIEFRKTLTNLPTSKKAIIENINGSVGWFDENFNGYNNQYEVTGVEYKEAVTGNDADGVIVGSGTTAIISVSANDRSFTSSDRVGVYISYLPDNEDEYTDTNETNLVENFLYDAIFADADGFNVAGSGIFKALKADVVAGNLEIEVDIEYAVSQYFNLTDESNYVIWIQVEDGTIIAGSSDRVAVIADVNNYQQGAFIPDLLDFDYINILQHNQALGSSPTLPLTQWNEDGVVVEFDFWLDTAKAALMTQLQFSLVAVNTVTGNLFELDNYAINMEDLPVSAGVQEIEIDDTRGYILADGDQFNNVKITKDVLDGTKQHYIGSIGQKIKWQDWILNDQADTVFYNKNEPNNNLNYKSSNYSNLNDYQIKVLFTANLTGLDDLGRAGLGLEQDFSDEFTVLDYDVNDSGGITGEIKTFDPDTMVDTGGVILRNKDTLFRAVFSGGITSASAWGINRIQQTGSLGDDISELSSLQPVVSGDILKPLSGETQLLLTDVMGDLYAECLIDYTKLLPNVSYDLSARINDNIVADLIIFGLSPTDIIFSGTDFSVVYGPDSASLYLTMGKDKITAIQACDAFVYGTVGLSDPGWTRLAYVCFKNADYTNFDLQLGTWILMENFTLDLTNSIITKANLLAILVEIQEQEDMGVYTGRTLSIGTIYDGDPGASPVFPIDPGDPTSDAILALKTELEGYGWTIDALTYQLVQFSMQAGIYDFTGRVTQNAGQSLILVRKFNGDIFNITGETAYNILGTDIVEIYHTDAANVVSINISNLNVTAIDVTENLVNNAITLESRRHKMTWTSLLSVRDQIESLVDGSSNGFVWDIVSLSTLNAIPSSSDYNDEFHLFSFNNWDVSKPYILMEKDVNFVMPASSFFVAEDDFVMFGNTNGDYSLAFNFTGTNTLNRIKNDFIVYLPINFTGIASIILSTNSNLSSIQFLNTGNVCQGLIFNATALTVIDISNVAINGGFTGTNCSMLQYIISAGSGSTVTACDFNNTALIDAELSGCVITSSDFRIANTMACQNISIGAGSVFTNRFRIGANDLKATQDFGDSTFNVTTQMSIIQNPDLTEIIVGNASTLTAGVILYDQDDILIWKQDGTKILEVVGGVVLVP